MIQQKSFPQMQKPAPKKKKMGRKFKIFLLFIVLLSIAFAVYVVSGLPSLEQLENPTTSLATEVFGSDGKLIGTFSEEARIEVKFKDLPPHLVNALIATEDRSFYTHWGVDVGRVFKAAVMYVFKRSGASTITQQLAKNLYNLKDEDENFIGKGIRKVREWITAVQIERNYTKQEIIEMYFNISPFGRGAYGIEMASRTYFKKSAKNLTINESAMLVAILKGAIYDPKIRPEKALARRNLVLNNMVEVNYLRSDECERLKKEPIKDFRDNMAQGPNSTIAGHFLVYIRDTARKLARKHGYDLEKDGLKIYTTIDSRMQEAAVNAVKAHLDSFQPEFDKYWKWDKEANKATLNDLVDRAIKRRADYRGASDQHRANIYQNLKYNPKFIDSVKKVSQQMEVAFVAIDPANGQIRAMVGGRNAKNWQGWNHADHGRQPGSAFKPFTYLAAIKNGLYPAFPIMDQEFNYNGWNPKNFDMKCTGRFMMLRDALKMSINTVTSRIIIEGHVSPKEVGEVAKDIGIKSKLDLFPSIALGTSSVTPIELVSSYATIANKGVYNEPIAILKITDKYGMVLESFTSQKREGVSEEDAFMLTDMLETALNNGTGARARQYIKFPAAGKTGTTQSFRDAWYVGFTPHLAAGVWVGFDDERISYNQTNGQGGHAALPIWAMFMRDAYAKCKIPQDGFNPPESGDIVYAPFVKSSITEYGDPKLASEGTHAEVISDIINKKKSKIDNFDPTARYKAKVFSKFTIPDTSAHQAEEIR